jgi:6-pyruvoyltetrahydropterin/6-carboxytetrahydropterin synthase
MFVYRPEDFLVFLVRVKTTFSAAHRLYKPELSDAENMELYGKCSNPNGHGHNYDLEVAVGGKIDPTSGMVINFYELTRLVDELIYNKVDHRNLNTDVDFMSGLIPTAENMALKFWEVLEPHIYDGQLYSISVGERGNNIVTYYGPGVTLEQLASRSALD